MQAKVHRDQWLLHLRQSSSLTSELRWGPFEIEGLITALRDLSSVLHPRSSSAIRFPVPGTFFEVMHKQLGKPWAGDQLWCDPKAWVIHSSKKCKIQNALNDHEFLDGCLGREGG